MNHMTRMMINCEPDEPSKEPISEYNIEDLSIDRQIEEYLKEMKHEHIKLCNIAVCDIKEGYKYIYEIEYKFEGKIYKPFDIDLKIGHAFEEKALNRMISIYGDTYNNHKWFDNSKCDFMINNDIKYEVKTDFKTFDTSNFFIEYEYDNKKSGITNTEAKYWILCDGLFFYKVKTKKLINLIQNAILISAYKKKEKELEQILINNPNQIIIDTRWSRPYVKWAYGFIIKRRDIIKISKLI